MSTARSSNAIELIELRTRAGYYRAMHARAVQREARLKRESVASRVIARKRRVIIKQRDASIRKLKAVIRERDRIIAEHDAKVEALKARIVWLEKKVFGRSTEKTGARPEDRCSDGAPGRQGDEAPGAATDDESTGRGRRRRGQQPGAPGHGRRPRTELPAETCSHELPDGVPCCAKCGKPYRPFGTEDSEQIEYEVRVYRRVHRRSRYSRACDCDRVPAVVTAPVPAKVIPKGMFAVSFWVHVILEKYLFQRPLNRVLATLELESLSLSQGTITEGLRRIGELLRPIYCRILERARRAARWKMDETGWSVFVEMEGKTGYHWWLWVVITDETVVYLLEPTRSGEVPRNFLGDDPEGSLLVDRYAVYQNLGPRLLVAFCWSHIRRDFVNVGEQYEYLALWAGWWVERINRLFAINDERVAVRDDPQAFAVKDVAVREAVAEMEQACDRELAGTGLRLVQRKTLKRLKKHWAGATLFVDHPEIPMDNNESERMLRDPVMGRKNYFGCGSLWSGELTSSCFSIFQTLLKNGVDPKQWLTAYLDACAHSGGKAPDDVDAFLPWNMTEERKVEWRYPSRPPRTPPQSGTAVVSLPLPGEQIRYLVRSGGDVLAALGFGAAAWKVAPRDNLIGWTPNQRKRNLRLIVNNARFLILPWAHAPNLASCVLARAAKQLPQDWRVRYGHAPVLLETFVERERFRGTCYRAANWIHVGATKGRGKLDVHTRYPVPVKDLFLYPLHKHFRRELCAAAP